MTDVKTAEKSKRNAGPIAVFYGTAEKQDFKRVPKGVTSIIIKSRNGETKTFDLASIPTEHLAALAGVAFASKAKGYVNNHADTDDKVVPLASEVWNDFVTGSIYSETKAKTAKGGARGRKFDPTLYVLAFQRAKETQAKANVKNKLGKPIQPATEKELESLKTQLVSMTGPDRTKKIKTMMENPVFKKAYLAVQAASIKVNKDEVSIDDMDFFFSYYLQLSKSR
jgi:hypothetical protein